MTKGDDVDIYYKKRKKTKKLYLQTVEALRKIKIAERLMRENKNKEIQKIIDSYKIKEQLMDEVHTGLIDRWLDLSRQLS